MTKTYELIESLSPEYMDKLLNHEVKNIDLQTLLISSPLNIVKYILKTDLKNYKLVKR